MNSANGLENSRFPQGGLQATVAILVKLLFVALVGALLGLVVTFATIEHGSGFSAVRAGPWVAYPKIGAGNIDPYARAMLAQSGEMSLGASEGLSFLARSDSAGALFNPACDYTMTGEPPKARYWTLTLLSPKGYLIGNAAQRHGFTSAEILRSPNGEFKITLSRQARPGNWLPIGDAKKFILVLRLYDTELSATTVALDAGSLPRLVKGVCR